MTNDPLAREVAALREAHQLCQSRMRLAIRTLNLLQKRLLRMSCSIEDAAIIFAHLHDAVALLEGEVLHENI